MMPTSKTQAVNHNQTSSMANFVARLMSLSAHELQSLHNDHELMRQMTETQLLMENRLQQAKLNGFMQQQQLAIHHQLQIQQQQQQQHQINQLNNQQHSPNGTTYQLAATQQSNQLQMDHYYAQALSNAVSQQYSANSNNSAIINPTSQHLLMASPQANQLQLALDLRTSQQAGYLLPSHHQNHNQHHHHHQFQANLGSPTQLQQQQQQQQQHQINQRLYSSAGSYYGSSASSVSSAGSSPVEQVSQKPEKQAEQQQAQRRSVNPKKIKLQEYQKQNISASMKLVNSAVLTPLPASNRAEPPPKRTCTINKQQTSAAFSGGTGGSGGGGGGGKKYKGEFDEPSPIEVEQRQGDLARPDTNYHASDATECACVLGSRFHNKSNAEMLAVIERWRQLPTEERIKSKWDVTDLPKDIPLNEIKKFEDLRKDFSNGRADFGGASKRKPLGIRGTRQFLLILYCLWGHPGREDPMQKEGYCPHCFARIKKANEQSTLVRVVNHFNMKHRRGANPRLSPHRDNLASAAASPQAATINITPINIANERQSRVAAAAAMTPPVTVKREEDSMLPKELVEHGADGHHNDDESDNKSSILSKSLSTSAASSPEPTAASDTLSSPPPSTNDDSSDTTKTVKPEQETSETTPSPPLTCSHSVEQADDTKINVKTEEKN